MIKALVDATQSEICALIKIVELGLQLQTSGEMADKSLNECVFEAACLINQATHAIEIVDQSDGADGREKTDMATDIRRMSKDELDALNESGRKWREHNKPAEDQKPQQQAPVAIPTTQLDLWNGTDG